MNFEFRILLSIINYINIYRCFRLSGIIIFLIGLPRFFFLISLPPRTYKIHGGARRTTTTTDDGRRDGRRRDGQRDGRRDGRRDRTDDGTDDDGTDEDDDDEIRNTLYDIRNTVFFMHIYIYGY